MNYLPGFKSLLELLFASTPSGVGKVYIPIAQALGRIAAVSTSDGAIEQGSKIGINQILHLHNSAENDIEIYLPPDVQLISESSNISSSAYLYTSMMLGLIAPGFYTHLIDNNYNYEDAMDRAARTGDLILWLSQEPIPTMVSDGQGGKTATEEIINGSNCLPCEHLNVVRFKYRQRTVIVFKIIPQLEPVVSIIPSFIWSICNHLSGLKRSRNLLSIRSNINVDLDVFDCYRLALFRIIDDGFFKISFDFSDLIGYHGLVLLPKGLSRVVKDTKYDVISFPGFF